MVSGENSTGQFPTKSQNQKPGSNRCRVDPTWELGLGDLPIAIWFLQQSPTCGLQFDNQFPRIMTHSLLKIVLLSAVGAAALLLNSCNTISGFGRDLQDASSAVQNR
jgi:predicted small secreted protein